jgi:hypothetical protein
MVYAGDKSAQFVGVEHTGVASGRLSVASGTNEPANVAGSGKFPADPAGSLTLDLDGA